MLKKVNAIIFGLAVLLAFGCGSENNQDDPQPENISTTKRCLLNNITSGGLAGSQHHYDANGRLIRIGDVTGQRNLINYDATGLIVTAKFYQYYLQDTSLTSYRVLEYFPNGLLKKTTDFRRVTSGAPLTESGSMTQNFNAAGQLLKRSYYSATNKVWPYHYSDYTHLPDWVVKEEHYQNTNNIPVLDFTSYYTFDNKKLPFTLSDFHKDGWGYGNVLQNTDVDKYNDTTIYSWSYQYNTKDYPTEMTSSIDGIFQYKNLYNYNCQ